MLFTLHTVHFRARANYAAATKADALVGRPRAQETGEGRRTRLCVVNGQPSEVAASQWPRQGRDEASSGLWCSDTEKSGSTFMGGWKGGHYEQTVQQFNADPQCSEKGDSCFGDS